MKDRPTQMRSSAYPRPPPPNRNVTDLLYTPGTAVDPGRPSSLTQVPKVPQAAQQAPRILQSTQQANGFPVASLDGGTLTKAAFYTYT